MRTEEQRSQGSPAVEEITGVIECKTEEDVLAMLDRMERLEAEAEALELSGAQQSSSRTEFLHRSHPQVDNAQTTLPSHQLAEEDKEGDQIKSFEL